MSITLAGSVLVASCLGCSGLANDSNSEVVNVDVGPVTGGQAFSQPMRDTTFSNQIGGADFRLPLKVGNDFSPSNWAPPTEAARFKMLDLSTPMAARVMDGDTVSAEVAFGASAERTGLGVDLEVAPRAQFQHDRAGQNVANFGGEVRLGQGLQARDLRHKNAPIPAWYFF